MLKRKALFGKPVVNDPHLEGPSGRSLSLLVRCEIEASKIDRVP